MFEQKNFGIKKYVNENPINSHSDIARVIQKNNHLYTIATIDKIIPRVKVAHKLTDKDFYVGDFVMFNWQDDDYYLEELLQRKNVISKASSHAAKSYHVKSYEQILATNVDQLYILIAADQRFTLSKLERYLMTFNQEKLELNILISKADYIEETKEIIETIHSNYPKVKITSVSMHQGESIQLVKDTLYSGKTAMFIGASGVGKSTLINYLTNNRSEDTNSVRTDGKGKHTTTVTKMLYLEETDSLLIDSPGFKTISTTNEVDGNILFAEIQDLAKYCKFNDCTHNHESGCAVIRAVEDGELSTEQLSRYSLYEKKLRGQLKYENMKQLKKQKKFYSKN
ncbi:ribosome small subunit-dependent GTPase A [Sporosarcina thermotolerans]|uniref:Small ribosomal subunit biogenesis GTPase RsgA n=2 Tax=Sporosarcina thermotolerans TaxID=633404 RepID=A0AAW9AAL4_9BACL|nr:ribosome small subunit-dependent GTPase A [Sporosarcina thermotolerans]MDW0117010.1 ribosome small subunit-dependent GTPase A [Sporosarcina thermotolerans]WHT47886.1 ribosome small subunit-dependent GTPase A [Sporosarcina thermotolerans]